jgi:RNA polymerase sigma-70 factor, ECF subfamily
MRADPLRNVRPLIERVYAYAAYRVGHGADAEDITSEVFERALRYRHSFDPDKGEPIAWLLGIARRCVDDRRQAAAPEAVDDRKAEIGEPAADADVVRRLSMREALEHLDERSRELVALRYAADLSSREIGDLMGLKPNAVDVALHRALSRLRELLDEDGIRPGPLMRPEESYPKG